MSQADKEDNAELPTAPRLHASWPLAGRELELAMLEEAIGSPGPRQPGPCGAVIVAPAGIGKTRLAREASVRARWVGFQSLWAVGTRAASVIPYGALAHLAPSLDPGDFDHPVSFHNAFIAALSPPDGEVPLLVVDDAQLLDPGSAALLLRIALTGAAVLLVTLRAGEPHPDPVAALWKDGLAQRMDLGPLGRDQASDLVRSALGGDIAEPMLRRLYDVTGGSPLHIREFVVGAVEAGSLVCRDGAWIWDGTVQLPARLVDVVRSRLVTLEETEREALAVLSLAEPLEPHLAQRVCDPVSLVALESAGMLRRVPHREGEPATAYRLRHPLLGEVALADTSPATRRRLLGDLAEAAAAGPLDGPGRMRLASWQLDSGGSPDDEMLIDAAEHANSVFAYAQARRLAAAALDHGADVRATVVLARALIGMGAFGEAADRLGLVEDEAHADPRALVRQEYLDGRVFALFHGMGDSEGAAAVLDRFRDACTDPHSRRIQATKRAKLALEHGSMRQAAQGAMPVAEDPDALDLARVLAAEVAGEAFAYLGDSASARRAQGTLREMADSGSRYAHRAARSVGLQQVLCLHQEGSLADAERITEENYRRWIPSYDDVTLGWTLFTLGVVRIARGRPASALRALRESAALLQGADFDGQLAWVVVAIARAEAMLGNGPAARVLMERAGRLPLSAARARARADFVLAEVQVRAASGDATGAVRTALESVVDFPEQPVHRARILHAALVLGAPASTVTPLLEAAAGECTARQPRLFAEHAAALAVGDVAALERLSTAFEDFGMALEAAELAMEAARIRGTGPAAERARARATRLAAECEGAIVHGLAAAREVSQLTRREREVARLAADGLSSPDIADRLVLSVRTVESHLYQVFAKLGVRRREEVAEALDAHSRLAP